MNMPADRTRPVDWHGPNGEEAKIRFTYGQPEDPVPKGFTITVRTKDGREQIFHEKAVYVSYEDARDKGIKAAQTIMRTMEK